MFLELTLSLVGICADKFKVFHRSCGNKVKYDRLLYRDLCFFFFFFPFALCLQVKSALNGASQLCRQGSVYDSPALVWGMWKV